MKKLLRIGEASQILRVSVSILRRWEKEGKLKPIRRSKSNSNRWKRNERAKR